VLLLPKCSLVEIMEEEEIKGAGRLTEVHLEGCRIYNAFRRGIS